jgi:hypothetical protein
LSPDAKDTIQRFFDNWIVKQDILAALQFLDLQALAAQEFRLTESPLAEVGGQLGASPQNGKKDEKLEAGVQTWAERFLVLGFVEDHGLLNQMGHGIPSAKGYEGFPFGTHNLSDSFRFVSYKSLNDAIYAPETFDKNELPYFVADTFSPETPPGSGFSNQEIAE